MVDNIENKDYDKILVEYKQISTLLFIGGIFLGSYVVLTSSSIWILIFSVLVLVYGIYSHYQRPSGQIGYFLLGLGLVWTGVFLIKYLIILSFTPILS